MKTKEQLKAGDIWFDAEVLDAEICISRFLVIGRPGSLGIINIGQRLTENEDGYYGIRVMKMDTQTEFPETEREAIEDAIKSSENLISEMQRDIEIMKRALVDEV